MITCVIPARNEAGHLEQLISEILTIPLIREIIIVEGGSTDETWAYAQKLARDYPDVIRAMQQSGAGKFDAVLCGSTRATQDLLIIWDADCTISSSDTFKMINEAMFSGGVVFGDRLRGRMSRGAMRPANFLGNWLFALAWMPLIRQKPHDMLCGTKIFPTEVLHDMPTDFLEHDPYGDFAIVLNSIRLNYEIRFVTVNYAARSYGQTNIQRWSGGFSLLRMTIYAYKLIVAKKLKLVS